MVMLFPWSVHHLPFLDPQIDRLSSDQETHEQETMESQWQYLVTNRTLFKIDKRLGPEEALSSDELPRQVDDDFVDAAWMGSRLRRSLTDEVGAANLFLLHNPALHWAKPSTG